MEGQQRRISGMEGLRWKGWQWAVFVSASLAMAWYILQARALGEPLEDIAWRVAPFLVGLCMVVVGVDQFAANRSHGAAGPDRTVSVVFMVEGAALVCWHLYRNAG